MKALITGGTGFAGFHLSEYLLEAGYDVILIDRPQSTSTGLEELLPKVRVERADLLDFERLRRIMADVRPERIFHLAAFSSVADSFRYPRECYATNFDGTLNLLQVWREVGLDARMLLVSSSDVYGRPAEAAMPLSEASPLTPVSHYGNSKVAAESLGIQFGINHGLAVVRVRPFQHTGPRQSPAFVCSGLARQVAEMICGLRPLSLTVGNPNIARDFSDVRDIVRGYTALIEHGQPGDVYLLCSGRAMSVGSIIEWLAELAPEPIQLQIDPSRARAVESPTIWGNAAKARAETGWQPRYELRDTLRDLVVYWKAKLRDRAL
jgi:GDP-4-dehydro-6-deoxy-D-mannose reductase